MHAGKPQSADQLGGRQVVIYPIFHPAAGLRTPKVKEQLREDFSGLPALLAKAAPRVVEPVEEEQPRADQLGLFG